MNIVLSCYAKKGKASFVLEKEGKVVSKDVFSVNQRGVLNYKSCLLEGITAGLRHSKDTVNHDDLLLIVVPSPYVAEWLSGKREQKGYELYIERVFEVLEMVDCRYMFVEADAKKAKQLINKGIDSAPMRSALSVMEGLE